jgi:hypothetical protein
MLRLRGTFADGSPIDFDVSIAPGTRVTLAAPGASGC